MRHVERVPAAESSLGSICEFTTHLCNRNCSVPISGIRLLFYEDVVLGKEG